jgi:hypothetical protein
MNIMNRPLKPRPSGQQSEASIEWDRNVADQVLAFVNLGASSIRQIGGGIRSSLEAECQPFTAELRSGLGAGLRHLWFSDLTV